MIATGRRRSRLRALDSSFGPVTRELLAASLSLAAGGARRCAAASSPPTTAPSTSRSAPTSTASRAAKEHERCGSHLVGPLLLTSAVGATPCSPAARSRLAASARRRPLSAAIAAATEIFSWMVRHPDHPVARALARPGHELQHRFATADPIAAQLEVAEAALDARASRRTRQRHGAEHPAARVSGSPRDLRPPGREDAGGLLHGRVLQPHARGAARRRAAIRASSCRSSRSTTPCSAGWTRRSRSSSSARDDWDALTVHAPLRRRPHRAVGDGDDDRGRLHALRPPRDRLPRRARAADADLDEHRARARGRGRQADHLHAGAPRPPPRPDRRRLRRLRRRSDARRARSASRPTRRRPGGAAAASAPSRTR